MDDRKRQELFASRETLLQQLAAAKDAAERDAVLDQLVRDHAQPLVATIAGRFRRSEPLTREDAEELASLVLLRLVRRLRTLTAPIGDLENYIATLVYHTLFDLRRERFPERTRLKNRLRYLLTRDPRLALWTAGETHVAGLAQWSGSATFVRWLPLERGRATRAMTDSSRPADAVAAILERAGGPVPFDVLVRVVCELWDIHDARSEPPQAEAEAESADALSSLAERQYMEMLWQEIVLLPPNQRTALLLNLREANGSNALALFVLLGICTPADLADALSMTVEELSGLWNDLPLEDRLIAERLGLTRQQVIDLRKSARARLNRRTAHLK